MKKTVFGLVAVSALITGPAMAADLRMPVKAPPAPIAQVFSWTGFYIGGEVGWGESRTDTVRNVGNNNFPAGFTGTFDQSGVLGGGVLGANYQINQFVLGVEGDWQASGIKGHASIASPLIAGHVTEENREINWVATVTGRVGLAWDRWLLYAKGGAAWRRVNESATNTTFNTAGAVLSSNSVNPETQNGYVIGGGLEWAFTDLVSMKLEGDWYNFGSGPSAGGICITGGCGGSGAIVAAGENSNTSREMWEVKGGVNIHFNFLSGGLASRY